MSNRSIAGVSFMHEQPITAGLLQASDQASLGELFNIITRQLVAFFRAKGFRSPSAEDLAQKVMCELTARVRAAVRGRSNHDSLDPVVIQIGELKLDLARRLFWRGNDKIHLSSKEFDLLAFMMNNSDVALPHAKLLRSVWGLEYGGELEYLRTYVRTLRKKIEKVPANPEYLVSVPWIGYRFCKPEDSRGAESQ
jgi:DNA-binding response OmpR family regulator